MDLSPTNTIRTTGSTSPPDPVFKLASYDSSLNSRIAMTFPVTRDPVHAMALSIDGKLLAIGNDAGRLEIRNSENGWETIRIYRSGGSIRTMLWHPSQDQTLFVGCGNGNIYRIKFQGVLQNNEEISFGNVHGFVHVIAFHDGKGQLAVGYGNKVVLFDRPFTESGRLGASKLLDVPKVHKGSDVRFHPFARGIHYLDQDTVLVAFYGKVGIMAYSSSTGDVLWGIKLGFTSTVCSSALSPSREILAITNTRAGIDWYSTTHKRYLMTTQYNTEVISEQLNYVVGATFIDDFTIAVGNITGRLIYAQLGMTSFPPELHVGSRTQVVQTVTSGEIDGSTTVITVLPVDDQGLQDKTRRSGEVELKAMVAVVVIRHPRKVDRAKVQVVQNSPALLHPPVQASSDSLATLFALMTMRDKYLSLALCIMIIFGAVALFPRNPTEDNIRNAPAAMTITTTKVELDTLVETVIVTSTKTELAREVETVTSMVTELARQFTTETIFISSSITSQASDSMCICTLTGTVTATSPN